MSDAENTNTEPTAEETPKTEEEETPAADAPAAEAEAAADTGKAEAAEADAGEGAGEAAAEAAAPAASADKGKGAAGAAGAGNTDYGDLTAIPEWADAETGNGIHWVTEPDQGLPLKIGDDGVTAVPPATCMDMFFRRIESDGAKTAMNVKVGEEWKAMTWNEYGTAVRNAAKAMIALGLEPHKGVSCLGFNSPEWFIADLGAIAAGGIIAGIYTTNGPDACHYILDHCDAQLVFVENEVHCAKILEIRERLPELKAIIQWSGTVPEGADVLSWDEFMATSEKATDEQLQERLDAQKPNECCTLIYTSGTTGPPKAVMISHDNLVWTSRVCSEMLGTGNDDHTLSYLPLSHIAAQMLDIHGPIATGQTIWFAKPDALKGSLGATLKEVRPTLFLGVPRVWEKIAEKMRALGANASGPQKFIGSWAKARGLEGGYNTQEGKAKPWGWWLANTLVFSTVRQKLGLDRCRLTATAAAPISKETLEYFLSLDIPIYEIYGMSECTGPQTISLPGPGNYKTGSCGKSMPGTDLVIDNPDAEGNGEITYRGRHIFMGYMKNPDSTSSTIDNEGFLHSGDIGRLDSDGFLYITGRIKELIITAGGENVPPVLIENVIKEELPYISNIMVIGDRRKFLSAVITFKTEQDDDGLPTNELTAECRSMLAALGSNATTVEEASVDAAVIAETLAGIKRFNAQATSNAQKVGKFRFLPIDFSIPGDELTPTMKLKRRIVEKKYAELIESMYEAGAPDTPEAAGGAGVGAGSAGAGSAGAAGAAGAADAADEATPEAATEAPAADNNTADLAASAAPSGAAADADADAPADAGEEAEEDKAEA